VTELLKQVGLEEGLEQVRERARAQGREEGRQQGALQTAQQAAISIVKTRFPELEQFVSEIIETISDLNRLQVLIVELSTVSSQEDAREILRSLVSGA
jgi:flagellar biosynthesis/type III secretory pathway protein FliH